MGIEASGNAAHRSTFGRHNRRNGDLRLFRQPERHAGVWVYAFEQFAGSHLISVAAPSVVQILSELPSIAALVNCTASLDRAKSGSLGGGQFGQNIFPGVRRVTFFRFSCSLHAALAAPCAARMARRRTVFCDFGVSVFPVDASRVGSHRIS